MKIKTKILIITLLMFFTLIMCRHISNGAISASSKTINSGESVSISISSNIPVCSYKVTMTSSGGLTFTNSSGGTGAGTATITDASSSGMTSLATYTFNAPNVTEDTTYTLAFTASAMEDENLNEVSNSSTTAKITVKAPTTAPVVQDPEVVDTKPAPKPTTTSKPATTTKKEEVKKSSDANLKELIVAEGAISPEFSADVKEYAISVPNEITALNITATQNDSKATVKIEGNSDLKVGENKVTITVIAEDGITNIYTINVTRQRINLSLTTLKIIYTDKDGNTKELVLTPTFDPSVLEYKLEEISYLINSLNIEAIANLEGAIVEIKGNDNLIEGQNTITITITMKAEPTLEGEEQLPDEVIVYTINVAKQAEPTFWQKVKNWFGGIAGTISTYYTNNQGKVTLASLGFCVIALLILSVYIVIDFNKYRKLIQKLKEINELSTEAVSDIGGNVDIISKAESGNVTEIQNIQEQDEEKIEDNSQEKSKIGKHF